MGYTLDLNNFKYTIDGISYTKFLSELTYITTNIYDTLYIEYINPLTSLKIISGKLKLIVAEGLTNLIPNPIITIAASDRYSDILNKLFYSVTSNYTLNLNSYNFSIDGITYSNYLSQIVTLQPTIYKTFYIKYKDPETPSNTITSGQLKLILTISDNELILNPRINITIGDTYTKIFNRLFYNVSQTYSINLNNYKYSFDGINFINYLSELAQLPANTYEQLYIQYPDPVNSTITLISDQLLLIVNPTVSHIIILQKINISKDDTTDMIFDKLFVVKPNGYFVDLNEYKYAIN
jgi:hypothetical protein